MKEVKFGSYNVEEKQERHYKFVHINGKYRGKIIFEYRAIGRNYEERNFFYVDECNSTTPLDVYTMHEAELEILEALE